MRSKVAEVHSVVVAEYQKINLNMNWSNELRIYLKVILLKSVDMVQNVINQTQMIWDQNESAKRLVEYNVITSIVE